LNGHTSGASTREHTSGARDRPTPETDLPPSRQEGAAQRKGLAKTYQRASPEEAPDRVGRSDEHNPVHEDDGPRSLPEAHVNTLAAHGTTQQCKQGSRSWHSFGRPPRQHCEHTNRPWHSLGRPPRQHCKQGSRSWHTFGRPPRQHCKQGTSSQENGCVVFVGPH